MKTIASIMIISLFAFGQVAQSDNSELVGHLVRQFKDSTANLPYFVFFARQHLDQSDVSFLKNFISKRNIKELPTLKTNGTSIEISYHGAKEVLDFADLDKGKIRFRGKTFAVNSKTSLQEVMGFLDQPVKVYSFSPMDFLIPKAQAQGEVAAGTLCLVQPEICVGAAVVIVAAGVIYFGGKWLNHKLDDLEDQREAQCIAHLKENIEKALPLNATVTSFQCSPLFFDNHEVKFVLKDKDDPSHTYNVIISAGWKTDNSIVEVTHGRYSPRNHGVFAEYIKDNVIAKGTVGQEEQNGANSSKVIELSEDQGKIPAYMKATVSCLRNMGVNGCEKISSGISASGPPSAPTEPTSSYH